MLTIVAPFVLRPLMSSSSIPRPVSPATRPAPWPALLLVLLGGEINVGVEHQTGRDSTKGRERPLGRREARMADAVGAVA